MAPPRRAAPLSCLSLLALLLGATVGPRLSLADDRLPGEAAELTDKVRAEAQKQVDVIVKGGGDALKARRALLVLGPAVWPVVDNALRLTPPDAARPHLNFLKAMLLTKTEPEFEYLRVRLRRKFLIDDVPGIQVELQAFRAGRPDPSKPGGKVPPSVRPTTTDNASVYRSADGTIVFAFGRDATAKKPDAPDVALEEATAGFVAAVGGKPLPCDRRSGKGGEIRVTAPLGFAYAWAADGAPGKAPGGEGGDAGSATAHGGAGEFAHAGAGGAGAPATK